MHLVMDISDVGTDDVLDWAGCSTSRTIYCEIGDRCSSVVRAFAHGAMGRRIDPSWGGPI